MSQTLRVLSAEEVELVSGGTYIPGYGWVIEGSYGDNGGFGGFPTDPYVGGGGEGGIGLPSEYKSTLSSGNDLTINIFGRTLNPVEQAALDHFKASVTAGHDAFGYGTKSMTVHLNDGTPNGVDVKLTDLAKLYQNADFVINEAGHRYDNGTTRGESKLNGGNPIISLNIDTLVAYDKVTGGMNYLPLHEIGHLSPGAIQHNLRSDADGFWSDDELRIQEMMANDTAYALQVLGHQTPVAKPEGGGYTPGHGTFH